MLRIAAIIPVKTFARAKSRLGVGDRARQELCKLMLDELLGTVAVCPAISDTVVVTGDPEAGRIAEAHGAAVVRDEHERGVNEAVRLAAPHVSGLGAGATVVLPQDIPFAKVQDLDFLLRNQMPPSFVTVVPSRKFDGTNALVRMPPDVIETSYDMDSYRAHMASARAATPNPSVLFVRRIMMDIDDGGDLAYALEANEKPGLCERIREITGSA